MVKKLTLFVVACLCLTVAQAATDTPDTLVVAQDGSAQFSRLWDAIEDCRAFMDYHKVIFVKRGTYKEKVVVPSWLTNIEILGEDRDETIITYDDHANLFIEGTDQKMGTFRTATVKVEGSDITFRNITLENNSGRKGQALALHTEGDRLRFINCRFLGNQDTVYTGVAGTRLYFEECYIEGTTDFIFGPSTAWFERCTIHSLTNSYITAASTPEEYPFGYVFHRCTLTHNEEATRVYLGRPWRDYGATLFLHCEMGDHILPEGWHNWGSTAKEQTARYAEYGNTGAGAATDKRVTWAKQLTAEEAAAVTPTAVFGIINGWEINENR